jgi:small-conductance mechanosensitive channel
MTRSKEAGIKEMLTSLGLLCLVSLLLALLSLIFLLKISPMTNADMRDMRRTEQLTIISADEYVVVYEVTLALCALTLSLNLCCLLVCAIQFLFAVKLVKSPQGDQRTNKYLQKSSITRVCAVGGFFVSIPVFLTGIILYTFIQFHSTPAIVTSVFIGVGIIFCGCAMVHNVFVWQKEKTNAVRALAQQHREREQQQSLRQPTPPTPIDLNKSTACHPRDASGSVSPGVPTATLDLSSVNTATSPHELSTLV